jgi:hypothetical protein
MRTLATGLIILALSVPAWAGPAQPWQVPLVKKATVVIDGAATPDEYPATFTDPKTGITVWWQADSANIYAALKSPGRGWLAIGLGADGMSGAAMVIAYQTDQGQWTVEEQLGKPFFKHVRVEQTKLISGKATLAEGRTAMEFALPRRLNNGQTIADGQPMPFILAYHKDKSTLSKHSKKMSGTLVLKPAAK